ncbi:hypothetical protein KA005_24020 [bacterium]|nr:hypothetical protein [bacterium]
MANPREMYDWNQVWFDLYKILEKNEVTLSWAALGRALGIPWSTLREACGRSFGINKAKDIGRLGGLLEIGQIEELHEAALIFADKKQKEDVNWREFAEVADANKAFRERISTSQRTAKVLIKTRCPIAVMFSGDWHLGDRYVDYETWVSDIEFLLSHDNLYMVDVGDDRQNLRVFRHLAAVFQQVLSPKQQAHMLRSVIEDLTAKDKLLAKVGGNHDEEFDQRIFGEALQSYLLEKMRAPFFPNRGLVFLTVGDIEYSMLLFHKSRYKSFLRRTHGAKREHQLSYPADIIAGGHYHQPGMEHLHHYSLADQEDKGFGGETIFIKVGTYQDSDYGWRYFSNGGMVGNYTVVLFPDQKKMIPFTNPRDAMDYLEMARIA